MIRKSFDKLKKYTSIQIILDSVKDFGNSDSMTFAAATAFYTIFSMPALLIIVLHIASTFYQQGEVREELLEQISYLVGEDSARTLDEVMANVAIESTGTWAQVIGIGILVFSATTVFVSLQNSINHIWHIKPKPEKGIVKFLINRLLSFSLVATIGFVLLVSLVIDAFIVIFFSYLREFFQDFPFGLASVANFVISQSLLVLIFGLMYKILPDAKVKWKDVWLGALVTMVLFALGKFLIGVYLGNADVGSAYGTAGSLVVVLIWVYYSVVIFLFGAQVTFFIAEKIGGTIIPLNQAVKVELIEIKGKGKEEKQDKKSRD